MSLHDNRIAGEDIASHCTLTSLYPILAMARVHSQNPRTYAEIMATAGDSSKIARDFVKNLNKVIALADASAIPALIDQINANTHTFDGHFLETCMQQARAIDDVLSRML